MLLTLLVWAILVVVAVSGWLDAAAVAALALPAAFVAGRTFR
ncbi:MAG: hypothetical protein U5K81_00625 [Trueperaceae bacterium]|nr:hypothetical protein [Trueperaceae bacterium]